MSLGKILDDHELWVESGGAKGKRATLMFKHMVGCDLRGRNLKGIELIQVDMRGSDMSGADMRGSKIHNSNLSHCKMVDTKLGGCQIWNSDLSRSDLQNADLREGDICGSDLRGCNMSGCDLSECDIRWASLPHSTLFIPGHHVTWWGDQLAIGCQQHPLEEWAGFSEEEINRVAPGALSWWRTWKDVIFQAVEASRGAYQ